MSALAAARAILARVRQRGGANNVGHLDAHELLRRAMGVTTTSPATWQATRAALDEAIVAKAIAVAHGNPNGKYPANLYNAGPPTDKPSQWVSPERRRELLNASRLGRTVLSRGSR